MPTRRGFITSLSAVALGSLCSIFPLTRRGNSAVHTQPSPIPSLANPTTKPAAVPALVMVPRSQWGAVDPSVSPDGRGEHGPYDPVNNPSGWMVYDKPLADVLYRIILHHSALPLSDGPREIQRLHMEEKGFADIGYHFLINERGQLFEGRSMLVRGAHTYGANEGSIGICLLGNFEEIEPAQPQLALLKQMLVALVARYPLIDRLAGHCDYNPTLTLCPGAHFYKLLPGLADEAHLEYKV